MLVDHGFRMQSAKDNRPLKFHEFDKKLTQTVYVSATPAEYEITISQNEAKKVYGVVSKYKGIAKQLIRPTGLLDPIIDIRPTEAKNLDSLKEHLKRCNYQDMTLFEQKDYQENQIDNLLKEINETVAKNQRVLVTTLTKRMSENLATYLQEMGIKVQYLHSDLDAIERVEILNKLRSGSVDVVVGINLLREGLDLPEVSLVAIMDADKEGFLRSETSMVQTIGRAARHSEGRVIMYADRITDSMKKAIDETRSRREIQQEYNSKHNITPTTIIKDIKSSLERAATESDKFDKTGQTLIEKSNLYKTYNKKEKQNYLKELEIQMQIYADSLEFEQAAKVRDIINDLKG